MAKYKKRILLSFITTMVILLLGCNAQSTSNNQSKEQNFLRDTLWNVWRNSNETQALVTNIINGNTIKVNIKKKEYTVFLTGIEADKPDTPNGQQAIEYLKTMTLNRTVILEKDIIGATKKSEIYAYVWLKKPGDFQTFDWDSIDKQTLNNEAITYMVNALMQSEGLTETSLKEPNVKHSTLFTRLQLKAREKKLGKWK